MGSDCSPHFYLLSVLGFWGGTFSRQIADAGVQTKGFSHLPGVVLQKIKFFGGEVELCFFVVFPYFHGASLSAIAFDRFRGVFGVMGASEQHLTPGKALCGSRANQSRSSINLNQKPGRPDAAAPCLRDKK